MIRNIKYGILILVTLAAVFTGNTQGIAGLFQNFGQGNLNPSTIGNPLPASSSAFTFSNDICPQPGSYTIMRRLPVNSCFNGEWIGLTRDNTPNMDYGMMMVVNNSTTVPGKLIYADTVNNALCAGIPYVFSVAVINIDVPSNCASGPDFPRFEMRLENENGQLILKDTTQPLNYADNTFGYKFSTISLNFIMPAGINKLVAKLSIINGSWLCAEDFAIDDFTVKPLGPQMNISFDNEPATTILKALCFQQNGTVSLSGQAGPYYNNTAYQWQQSENGGITWQDIPGASTQQYARTFSVPGTYLFRLTAAEATNITNPYCRVASRYLTVQCDGLPTNYQVTSNSPFCSGRQLQLNATGAARYEWHGPNGFYENVASPQIFNTTLADSGMYYVEIFSLGGCRLTDSTRVVIYGTDVFAERDTSICLGESVQLKASNGVACYWWPQTALTGVQSFRPIVKPKQTTVYSVAVTDQRGCTDTASVTITVRNKIAVKAIINANGFLCRPYDSTRFISNSEGNINNWNWNFGNGQTSTEKQPPVQYYSLSAFQNGVTVTLAVKDTVGCTDTTTFSLQAVNNCLVAVPSAFSPNNDGVNDFLYPLNAYKPEKIQFRVYNRLGQLMFQTNNREGRWNGDFGGKPQPPGAYIWTLEYNDISNRRIRQKGTVMLLR